MKTRRVPADGERAKAPRVIVNEKSPEKPFIFLKSRRLNALAAFFLTILFLYFGRVFALWGLAQCFSAWNLNAKTLAYAPVWAQNVAALSGEIADIFALFLALATGFGLARALKLYPPRSESDNLFLLRCAGIFKGKNSAARTLLFLALGAALSLVLIGLMLAFGSVRIPHAFGILRVETPVFLLRDALLCACLALLSRVLISPVFRNEPAFAAASAALQTAFSALLLGKWNLTLFLTAGMFGLVFACLYRAQSTCVPEIAFAFAFRAAARRIFGFPNQGGVYPVSENWLTGAEAGGLEGSGALLIVLAAALLSLLILRIRRRES